MRRLPLFGLISAISLVAPAAFAAQATATLSGTYSIGEPSAYSAPYITNNFGSGQSGNFNNITLTSGVATTPASFFTASPTGYCYGSDCSTDASGNKIETDTLTVNFSNVQVSGYGSIANFGITATYTAKYSGSILSCAAGDGKSPSSGETDCIVWSGASNTYNGSTTLVKQLNNGYSLDIFLYNATDWSITPTIAFELIDPPASVPEPATLGIVGAALAGLGLVRRRRVG